MIEQLGKGGIVLEDNLIGFVSILENGVTVIRDVFETCLSQKSGKLLENRANEIEAVQKLSSVCHSILANLDHRSITSGGHQLGSLGLLVSL